MSQLPPEQLKMLVKKNSNVFVGGIAQHHHQRQMYFRNCALNRLVKPDLLVQGEGRQIYRLVTLRAGTGSLFECFPKKYSGLKVELKMFATLYRKGHRQFIGRTCEPPSLPLRIDRGILG